MTTPTKNKNINEAFCKAQALIGGARKSSTNPHFKSKYADLKECFNACSDILNEHGIHISQPTMQEGDLFVIRTILTHTSGETMQDFGVRKKPCTSIWQRSDVRQKIRLMRNGRNCTRGRRRAKPDPRRSKARQDRRQASRAA